MTGLHYSPLILYPLFDPTDSNCIIHLGLTLYYVGALEIFCILTSRLETMESSRALEAQQKEQGFVHLQCRYPQCQMMNKAAELCGTPSQYQMMNKAIELCGTPSQYQMMNKAAELCGTPSQYQMMNKAAELCGTPSQYQMMDQAIELCVVPHHSTR